MRPAGAAPGPPRTARSSRSPVDFDLAGLVGIRLIDASASDEAAVERQVGPLRRRLNRPADITIRFVPRLKTLGPLWLFGLGETGFTADSFLVLRGKDQSPIRCQVPLDQLGQPCEFVCQSGLTAVPLLIAAVNLAALGRGVLPLHAAAFSFEGRGVLVTGWAKGGKTEALLAFADHGATYLGDEWVYLDEGGCMYGIPEPIRLWDWHLADLPGFRRRLSRRSRLKLWTLRHMASLCDWGGRARLRRLLPQSILRRLAPSLRKQLYVQMPPHRLFGTPADRAAVDKVFFVASHDLPQVVVRPIGATEIARRMVFSLQEEQQFLRSHYLMFRFAFPDRPNPWIDRSEEIQRERLERFLAGKEAYEVLHPYPAPIPELYRAMRPWL